MASKHPPAGVQTHDAHFVPHTADTLKPLCDVLPMLPSLLAQIRRRMATSCPFELARAKSELVALERYFLDMGGAA